VKGVTVGGVGAKAVLYGEGFGIEGGGHGAFFVKIR